MYSTVLYSLQLYLSSLARWLSCPSLPALGESEHSDARVANSQLCHHHIIITASVQEESSKRRYPSFIRPFLIRRACCVVGIYHDDAVASAHALVRKA